MNTGTARGAAETAPTVQQTAVERQHVARAYDRLHNWLFVVDAVLILAIFMLLLWRGERGWSFALQHGIENLIGANPWASSAGYALVLLVGYTLALLPYAWWKGWYLERAYGLGTQPLTRWLWDEGKALGLTLALGIPVIMVFYWLLRSTGAWWWLCAAGAWIVLQVVLGMVFPVLILPLFYTVAPLQDTALLKVARDIARQARFDVLGLYRLDLSAKTVKANAALAGLGATKRILLGDTLLQHFPLPEIAAIIAHECGHYYHRHIWKLVGAAAIIIIPGMWLADAVARRGAALLGITDIAVPATLPLFALALFVFGLATMPATNMISRYFEWQADAFALRATGDAPAFIAAMRRLAEMNLAYMQPHPVIEFLLHSHPCLAQRIAFARAWTSREDAPQ